MDNQEILKTILKFMPKNQAYCFIQGVKGSEHDYFLQIARKINQAIESAPAIYETDSKGDEVKPILHYFYGSVDIYVTEIDKSEYNQHFGYIRIGTGNFEAGYIKLDCIFKEIPLINLDFHFVAKAIRAYKENDRIN